jgi:hypothetical protein
VSTPAQTFLVDGAVDYEALAASGIGADVFNDILPSAWAAEYRLLVPMAELVDVDLETLTYFVRSHCRADTRRLRPLCPNDCAAAGRAAARPPLLQPPRLAATDRGHLAAHTIGGGADINLVAQDHLLNVSGAWRSFERHLQRHPGTLFAVRARYLADDDRPHAFVYSMIRDDGRFVYREFRNAPAQSQHSAG